MTSACCSKPFWAHHRELSACQIGEDTIVPQGDLRHRWYCFHFPPRTLTSWQSNHPLSFSPAAHLQPCPVIVSDLLVQLYIAGDLLNVTLDAERPKSHQRPQQRNQGYIVLGSSFISSAIQHYDIIDPTQSHWQPSLSSSMPCNSLRQCPSGLWWSGFKCIRCAQGLQVFARPHEIGMANTQRNNTNGWLLSEKKI